jgi:hypothetical protein
MNYLIITLESAKQLGNTSKEKYRVFPYVGKSTRTMNAGKHAIEVRMTEAQKYKDAFLQVMSFASDRACIDYCKATQEYLNSN